MVPVRPSAPLTPARAPQAAKNQLEYADEEDAELLEEIKSGIKFVEQSVLLSDEEKHDADFALLRLRGAPPSRAACAT